MEKTVSLLGSTGSIGTQSIEVARAQKIRIKALAAKSSTELLEKQAREFMPELAVAFDEKAYLDLKQRLSDTDIRVASGREGLIEAACCADTVITAVLGAIGLEPTLEAAKSRKRIALANKETLVCAGEIVMKTAEEYGAEIVPVDSEHSAIFQSLDGHTKYKRILLTASGGPFRGKKRQELEGVTKKDALKHPNWSMGAKITIDSATLMNKGLEFIEAMHLFKANPEQIKILVHPQSIVHSAVEFEDNSVIAQLGVPDMRLPIQYALTYPERAASPFPGLDLTKLAGLTFEEPDMDTFRCLPLAIQAAKTGGTACCVMNAANEEAVAAFLQDKIGFFDICTLAERALESVGVMQNPSLDDILKADREARNFVRAFVKGKT